MVRGRGMTDFWKYHGLGNDYLVIEPSVFDSPLTPSAAQKICDRTRGVGGDGILLGPTKVGAGFGVRIINPDGSEAEKSGNGLRIFARYLWDRGYAKNKRFDIHVAGAVVAAEVLSPDGTSISLQMGRVSFRSSDIPMTGSSREVLREKLLVGDTECLVSAANVGNPHCVVEVEAPTVELAAKLGPLIENHEAFPQRTNVQFMTPVDEHSIRIEIWERGAGATLSSGTSSCASAAVACRLGLCKDRVAVHTRGGVLTVTLDEAFNAKLQGGVAAVGSGAFAREFLAELGLGSSQR